MGELFAKYEIMPENPDVDMKKVLEKLPSVLPAGVKLQKTGLEEAFFGMMKLTAEFIIDDSDEGVGGKLEAAISEMEGVGEISCVDSTVL
ncbi:MAG: translation elongation factor EF-1beta [Candidatus Methanomethylophilaceae archaeon]|jgi:translation elongation factor aEF-1 beta|nr:translation elongation factor EF-1beta [Candidatus Methanomethylophilaceae archaeon]